MTATPEARADMAKHRDRSEHLLNNGFRVEHEPTYTLDRDIAEIRQRIGTAEYHRQMDDWNETNALHDDAWDRYTRHGDPDIYRRDIAEINGRIG